MNHNQRTTAPVEAEHDAPRWRPLPVEPTFSTWHDYRIAHYQDGEGAPVLLVHSINAAASAFEMRGPFVGLRDQFQVHALDLLGYGLSDRPARQYQADDYIEIIGAELARIAAPTAVVASSLGAAYAIAAADRWPERVRALVLVCPVGVSQLAKPAGPVAYGIYRVLRGPVGRTIFRLLTSRWGTRYYLRQQAYAQASSLTDETLDGFYNASHQPGGYYAPICFLTTLLNCDIAAAFARLDMPILLVWGNEATTTPPSKAEEFLVLNRRAQLITVDNASMLVQDELPAKFNALVKDFLV